MEPAGAIASWAAEAGRGKAPTPDARPAYRSTVEDSVYVAQSALGRNVGNMLMTELIERCGLDAKELEQALLRGEIDVAVHSFKDVPVTQPLVAVEMLTEPQAIAERADRHQILGRTVGRIAHHPAMDVKTQRPQGVLEDVEHLAASNSIPDIDFRHRALTHQARSMRAA